MGFGLFLKELLALFKNDLGALAKFRFMGLLIRAL